MLPNVQIFVIAAFSPAPLGTCVKRINRIFTSCSPGCNHHNYWLQSDEIKAAIEIASSVIKQPHQEPFVEIVKISIPSLPLLSSFLNSIISFNNSSAEGDHLRIP
ncbi:hypothetical protein L596_012737 [Steinernema carpocapsae]|uniref:Uncharacterized protein n=1 Tax=Steinernema carpocapsae TaxID=34508 RepID=A0A4U5NY03_STECR|nr:hypothetical protein L596_012737 [Steinernema carpocapsae]